MSPNRGACNGKMQGPGMFPGPCIFPHDTSPHIGRTIYPPVQANKRRTEKGGDTFRIRRYPAIFAVGRSTPTAGNTDSGGEPGKNRPDG